MLRNVVGLLALLPLLAGPFLIPTARAQEPAQLAEQARAILKSTATLASAVPARPAATSSMCHRTAPWA